MFISHSTGMVWGEVRWAGGQKEGGSGQKGVDSRQNGCGSSVKDDLHLRRALYCL